jgi:hypothetical protein
MQIINYNDVFNYKDGDLFWKVSRGRARAGAAAGCVQSNGRKYVRINGQLKLSHRVIWEMHKGWCPEFLDHINGDPLDNRIENLRPATKQQNAQNKKVTRRSKTGVKGVSPSRTKFVATLYVGGKNVYLGTFDRLDAAGAAYFSAAKEHFKEFATCRS